MVMMESFGILASWEKHWFTTHGTTKFLAAYKQNISIAACLQWNYESVWIKKDYNEYQVYKYEIVCNITCITTNEKTLEGKDNL